MSIFGVKLGLGLFVVALIAGFIGYKYGARVVSAVTPS